MLKAIMVDAHGHGEHIDIIPFTEHDKVKADQPSDPVVVLQFPDFDSWGQLKDLLEGGREDYHLRINDDVYALAEGAVGDLSDEDIDEIYEKHDDYSDGSEIVMWDTYEDYLNQNEEG